ncbi:hypothetical protein VKT23_006130 [Stygiomarasmius scandens]|uniref:Uncharacterized protein n=1 Tax=Marasmiellus scandens TaxID=2682957 RepID=A0ABR1JPA1_9AGAR
MASGIVKGLSAVSFPLTSHPLTMTSHLPFPWPTPLSGLPDEVSSEAVIVVVDDSGISFLGPLDPQASDWQHATPSSINPTFNGTYTWVLGNSTNNHCFMGSHGLVADSFTIYGFTPPMGFNQTYGLGSADSSEFHFSSPPGTGTSLLTSNQSFDFYPPKLTVIDYVTIPVTNKLTNLTGQTILVDDTSPEIHWKGNWTVNKNEYVEITLRMPESNSKIITEADWQWLPHGNSTHSSQNKGDSFTFRFMGTSIKVIGSSPGVDNGNQYPSGFFLSLNFTLDTNSTMQKFDWPGYGTPAHFPYFSADSLNPNENHTLTMSIVEVYAEESASLPQIQIDYLTYTASFTNLVDKPDFSSEFSSDGTDSSTSARSSPTTTSATNNVGSSARIGAIAGGTIGGTILFALAVLASWFCRRKNRSIKSFHDFAQTMMEMPTAFTLQAPVQPNTHSEKAAIIAPSRRSPTTARRHSFSGFSPTSSRDAEVHQTTPNLAIDRLSSNTDQTHRNSILDAEVRPTENGYRELVTRIDILTAALRGYAGPPEYVSEYRSEAGQSA